MGSVESVHVLAGQLQPLVASLDHQCSPDGDKYHWPACFELHTAMISNKIVLMIVVYEQVNNSLPMVDLSFKRKNRNLLR